MAEKTGTLAENAIARSIRRLYGRLAGPRHGSVPLAGGLLLLVLTACSADRALEAKRLLLDLVAGPRSSDLKTVSAAPARTIIGYRVQDRSYEADLYVPADGAAAAVVVVPGVTPKGREDPRFQEFVTSLARVRLLVLVPEIANLRKLQVQASDARAVGDALAHLSGPDAPFGPWPRVGLVAVSYAAGPSVIAASAREIEDRVAFMFLIGGYYDIEAVVAYFTTGQYRDPETGQWRPGDPNPMSKWHFLLTNAARVPDARDRVLLDAIARRRLPDEGADISDLAGGLGPDGRHVLALVTNRDPDRVPALIGSLPDRLREDLHGLDVKRLDLKDFGPRLILVHGRNDPIIPYSESKALAAAVPQANSDLTLIDNLHHVEIDGGDLFDGLALWSASYRFLQERDRLSRDPGETAAAADTAAGSAGTGGEEGS